MIDRPIIDAGPALNFMSINCERILFSVLTAVCVPETVRDEVLGKASSDRRFASAAAVWSRLKESRLHVLFDDETPELAAAVNRITGLPMVDRKAHAKDLGELMVVAHAVVAAEVGASVIVVIDDQGGARTAHSEMRRLDRLRGENASLGTISLINTITILQRAARTKELPDKATMREVYGRLRGIDDGLPPIETTDLLSRNLWRPSAR